MRGDGDGVDNVGDCWLAGETLREECAGGTEKISSQVDDSSVLILQKLNRLLGWGWHGIGTA